MGDFLLYEQNGALVTLTMNQPDKRNPLTGNDAVPDFHEAIERIEADPSVRCVILTGNGPSFSAGGDIQTIEDQASPVMAQMTIRHWYRKGIQSLSNALFNLEVPIIAAVNGHAMGAGLDLACMCDIRIASDKAVFAESFIKLGIIPGDGGAWLLPRVIGMARAAELAFTADVINAAKALEWNLVSQVVPHDQLMSTATALAQRIAQHPSHGVRLTKRLMKEGIHARLDSILELSAAFQCIAHKTADHHEAVRAFKEKRPPVYS